MSAPGNRLLDMFGEEARAQLDTPVTVQLKAREVLQEPGMPAPHGHFPLDAVVSLVATSEDGGSVEVGLIGREGMVGLAGVLGTVEGATAAIVQVSGAAVRVSIASLKALRLANERVRKTLDRYIEARLIQTAQAVACSRLHPVRHGSPGGCSTSTTASLAMSSSLRRTSSPSCSASTARPCRWPCSGSRMKAQSNAADAPS
jgi:CRP-like cAMP-binding protein